MESKQMKFTNRNQLEKLVSTMEENLEVARGHGKRGLVKIDLKTFWNELAENLNSMGPPNRDGNGWLKVWNDQKYAVKKKLLQNNKFFSGTGGGPNRTIILNKLEESIADMLKLQKVVNPRGSTFGIGHSTISESVVAEPQDVVAAELVKDNIPLNVQPSATISSPKQSRKRKSIINEMEERMLLIKEQTGTQAGILKEHQETNKYLRRISKIEDEKLRILKEDFEDKKRFRQEFLRIQAQKLEETIVNKIFDD